MARWVCDYCGETGVIPAGEDVESVLCTTCGEPVLPSWVPTDKRWGRFQGGGGTG